MGSRLDPALNARRAACEAEISPPGAAARVFVVPTNEELLIARDTCRIVSGLAARLNGEDRPAVVRWMTS